MMHIEMWSLNRPKGRIPNGYITIELSIGISLEGLEYYNFLRPEINMVTDKLSTILWFWTPYVLGCKLKGYWEWLDACAVSDWSRWNPSTLGKEFELYVVSNIMTEKTLARAFEWEKKRVSCDHSPVSYVRHET